MLEKIFAIAKIARIARSPKLKSFGQAERGLARFNFGNFGNS
jgi:hypothetical protein